MMISLVKNPQRFEPSEATITDPLHQLSTPLLASTILLMGFAVVGMRVVFSRPQHLPARWIFQVTPVQAGAHCVAAYRRSLWVLAILPVWAASALLLLSVWPWRAAAGHLLVLGLVGAALVEFSAQENQRIPFACSWLPGRSNLHITFWFCAAFILAIVFKGAEFERGALGDAAQYSAIVFVLGAIAAFGRWRSSRFACSESAMLQFEQAPSWQMVALNLPRDGGLPMESSFKQPAAP